MIIALFKKRRLRQIWFLLFFVKHVWPVLCLFFFKSESIASLSLSLSLSHLFIVYFWWLDSMNYHSVILINVYYHYIPEMLVFRKFLWVKQSKTNFQDMVFMSMEKGKIHNGSFKNDQYVITVNVWWSHANDLYVVTLNLFFFISRPYARNVEWVHHKKY